MKLSEHKNRALVTRLINKGIITSSTKPTRRLLMKLSEYRNNITLQIIVNDKVTAQLTAASDSAARLWLLQAIKYLGTSQVDLAHSLELSPRTMRRYLARRNPQHIPAYIRLAVQMLVHVKSIGEQS